MLGAATHRRTSPWPRAGASRIEGDEGRKQAIVFMTVRHGPRPTPCPTDLLFPFVTQTDTIHHMMNSSLDESAVSVSSLVVRRGHSEILHRVSLSLPRSSVTGLLGPSGCGKSTVTLTLNGLVPHSVPSDYRGSVLVGGQEVADADIAHLARTVAMVMQDPDSQIVNHPRSRRGLLRPWRTC